MKQKHSSGVRIRKWTSLSFELFCQIRAQHLWSLTGPNEKNDGLTSYRLLYNDYHLVLLSLQQFNLIFLLRPDDGHQMVLCTVSTTCRDGLFFTSSVDDICNWSYAPYPKKSRIYKRHFDAKARQCAST